MGENIPYDMHPAKTIKSAFASMQSDLYSLRIAKDQTLLADSEDWSDWIHWHIIRYVYSDCLIWASTQQNLQ